NNAIASAPTARLLVWDRRRGMHRSAKHPLDQATERVLAVIAADAADLLCGSDADKLAACGAPRCSRFLLRTHAARQWCSVRCGDRVRAARAYARRAERRGVGQAAPQS
ncbi:MAG: CGNR zinc finger domain-containing protein, partial [Stackebrandtia sp.]